MKLRKLLNLVLVSTLIFSFTGCVKQNAAASTAQKTTGGATEQAAAQTKAEAKKGIAYPITIKDSYDRQITIEKEPQRVISVAPNITEAIFAVDRGDRLIGRTEYCDYPESAKSVQSIGTLQKPNIEKIAELKPDLVIASTHFKKEVLQKLEEINIKVVVLYGEESFDGVYSTIENIGQVLNAQDKANEVVASMKKKVREVQDKVAGKAKPSVYYVVSYGKFGDYTSGKGTFIANMIEMAGGKNAADDVEGWKYSLEKLVEKNPDIMICSKSNNTKQGISSTNGYMDLKAVKEGKLFEIDENLLNRQGPRLVDGLAEIAKIIHPDLFK